MYHSRSIQEELVVCGMEPIQFESNFNGVPLHWKYQPLRKSSGRYIHAGGIPTSHKPRGGLIVVGTVVTPSPGITGTASVVGYYTEASPHEFTYSFHPETWNPEKYNRICYTTEPYLHSTRLCTVCQWGFGSGRARSTGQNLSLIHI